MGRSKELSREPMHLHQLRVQPLAVDCGHEYERRICGKDVKKKKQKRANDEQMYPGNIEEEERCPCFGLQLLTIPGRL